MLRFEQGVIGHRGACAYAPENTMVSFKKAHELGIQWVEFDVMLSSDKVAFVFHDEQLNRTTDGTGYIDESTSDDLKKLDAGSWFDPVFAGERIPLLSDVIRFLIDNDMYANVEIKTLHDNDREVAWITLDVIKKIIPVDDKRLLFSSFSVKALEYLNEHAPLCQRALLIDEWDNNCINEAKRLGCLSVNMNHEIMTPERAAAIKSAGLNLLCYTVDDANRAEELRSWGVDAVFSNKPDVTKSPELVRTRYCRM